MSPVPDINDLTPTLSTALYNRFYINMRSVTSTYSFSWDIDVKKRIGEILLFAARTWWQQIFELTMNFLLNFNDVNALHRKVRWFQWMLSFYVHSEWKETLNKNQGASSYLWTSHDNKEKGNFSLFVMFSWLYEKQLWKISFGKYFWADILNSFDMTLRGFCKQF